VFLEPQDQALAFLDLVGSGVVPLEAPELRDLAP
jgi:hypothetical protein